MSKHSLHISRGKVTEGGGGGERMKDDYCTENWIINENYNSKIHPNQSVLYNTLLNYRDLIGSLRSRDIR